MKLEEAIKSTKFKNQAHKAGLNIMYTAWCLKTALSQVLKEFDLTHEQYNVMRILKGRHPEAMCVRDIACRMIEKNSNVPRIIDRLVTKDWVVRNTSPEDKRETLIGLTQTGADILTLSTKKVDSSMSYILNITEDEGELLNSILVKIQVPGE